MRNEQRKKRLRKILIFLGVLIIIFLSYFAITEISKRSKISNVVIQSDNLSCVPFSEVEEYVKKMNLNYFTFKQVSIEGELRKKYYCIGQVETKLSYPDKLELNLKGREGAFVVTSLQTAQNLNPIINLPDTPIATDSTQEAVPVRLISEILNDYKDATKSGEFVVDKEGVIFESLNTETKLPRLSLLGFDLKVGSRLPDDIIKKSSEINLRLKELGLPSDNLVIVGDKFIVDSKPRIVFSLKKAANYQTASLQLILRQAKMNSDPPKSGSNNIESIDLRFDKPVVIYSK